MLKFGLPTVPAEMSVFLLNVVDRFYLFRYESAGAAGLYSLAVKLAAVVVFTVRAFQYAWPPLAYSIKDDREAGRVYSFITTYYVLGTGMIVAGLTLLGRWVVRLFAAPDFFGAHEALPWVALGWALYGLFLVFVVMAGRAQVTTRNFPAALAGLAVNVVLLVVLVPPLGISGAGIALVGAYTVMLALMYLFTRSLFAVAFQWTRLRADRARDGRRHRRRRAAAAHRRRGRLRQPHRRPAGDPAPARRGPLLPARGGGAHAHAGSATSPGGFRVNPRRPRQGGNSRAGGKRP